jgi:hypothetical protein
MSDTPLPPGDGPTDPIDTLGRLNGPDLITYLESLSTEDAAEWLRRNREYLSPQAGAEIDQWSEEMDIAAAQDEATTSVVDQFDEQSPEQTAQAVFDNWSSWTPEEQADIADWLKNEGGLNQDSPYFQAYQYTQGEADAAQVETIVNEEALGEAADAWADILANTPEGEVADPDRLNAYLPAGTTGAEAEAFIAAATEQGQAQADDEFITNAVSRGASPEEARALAAERRANQEGNLDAPLWLLRFVSGGRNLTDTVKQRYLDYWNDDHGTNLTSWNQLTPILESMGETTYTQNMTNAVLDDVEPLISHSIEIPFVNGARRLNYTEGEMATLRDMGFSNDAITRLVRLNALNAGRDAIEPGSTGDTIPIFAAAGLLRYFGGGPEFGTYNQVGQNINALEAQLGLDPGEYQAMSRSERQALRSRYEQMNERQQSSEAARGLAAVKQMDALLAGRETIQGQGRAPGVMAAQNSYRRGLDTYNGDTVLAFIHAVDPSLAQRIAGSGEDPTKLSPADNAQALRIMDRGGMLNRGDTMFERLGGRIQTHIFSQLSYFDTADAGGGGGGAGPIRRELDPVSVKEQLQKQFSDLMLDDIPDDVVSSVFNMLQGQLDKAPEGMSFDVSARILDWVQGRPEYAELYGNKPQGMNEAEYQTSFMAGVQDMLGAEANPEAVKAGMRENQYQTAVGRASAGQGLLTNSRLRGNWAAAKQTLDKFS